MSYGENLIKSLSLLAKGVDVVNIPHYTCCVRMRYFSSLYLPERKILVIFAAKVEPSGQVCLHDSKRMMLTRNEIKMIRALERKRERDEQGLFLAEGPKIVSDLLGHFDCRMLVLTQEYLEREEKLVHEHVQSRKPSSLRVVSQQELERASLLQSPRDVLAVFEKPKSESFDLNIANRELVIALDGVQDPGNVGTILRIADWFGVKHILCSPDTADVFSPKVVQATMGAVARVRVHYQNLFELIKGVDDGVNVMGTYLDGENIYSTQLPSEGILLMGSEGHGISEEMGRLVTKRLHIPAVPCASGGSESLNVAVATAICVSELKRNTLRDL